MASDFSMNVGIGIDGEKEFKAAVENINKDIRVLGSEMKKVSADFNANGASLEALTSKQDVYEKQAAELTNKIKLMSAALDNAKNTFGENSDKVKDWEIKLNNAQAELYKTEKNVKDTKEEIDKFGKEVDEAGDKTEKAADQAGLLKKIFAGGMLANVASDALRAVVSKLKDLAREAFDTADNLKKMSDVTGRSVEELQQLQYVGDDVGVSLDTITSAQSKFTRAMGEAQKGTKNQLEAFEKLGVEYQNADGTLRNSTIVMYEAFNALGKMGNETERDALALELMGRSAMELNPLIKAGSEELYRLSTEAKNAGAVMSEDAVNALDAAGDALDHVKQSAMAFVGEALAGIIGKGKTAASAINKLSDALTEAGDTQQLIEKYRQLSLELDNTSLSKDEVAKKTEELNSVKQQLIAVSQGVVTQLGDETDTLDEQVNTLDRLNNAQKKLYKQEMLTLILANTGTAAEKRRTDAVKDAQKQYDEYVKAIDKSNKVANNGFLKLFDTLLAADPMYKSAAESAYSYKNATEQATTAINQMDADTQAAYEAIRTLADIYGYTSQELVELGISADAVNAALSKTAVTTMTNAEAAAQYGMTTEQLMLQLGLTTQAQIDFDASQQAQQTTALALKDKIIALGTEISALQDDYNAAYAAAKKSLDGTVGLWETLDTKAVKTVKEVQDALNSQIEWLRGYNANLESLAGRKIPGVDTSVLVKSLSDGSDESAAILAGLTEATDEEIASIVDSMGDVEQGKTDLAGIMANVQTDWDKRWKEITARADRAVDEMEFAAEAGTAARNTMNGYITATYAMIPNLETAYRQAAVRADKAYRAAQQIKSPSRVAMDASKQYFAGIIIGAKNAQAEVEKTFAEVAAKADISARVSLQPFDTHRGEMSTITNHFTLNGVAVRAESDIKRIATELYKLQRRTSRGAGIA